MLPFKVVQNLLGQRLKEGLRNPDSVLSQTSRALAFSSGWQATDLRHRYVSLAEQYGFAPGQATEVFGQVGFCLVYVQTNHSLLSNQEVN